MEKTKILISFDEKGEMKVMVFEATVAELTLASTELQRRALRLLDNIAPI